MAPDTSLPYGEHITLTHYTTINYLQQFLPLDLPINPFALVQSLREYN